VASGETGESPRIGGGVWCYYDPTTGTFLTRDPLDGVNGTPVVANPYAYADNDPLNRVDPLGLRPCDANFKALSGLAHNEADATGHLHQLSEFLRTSKGTACLESLSSDGHGRVTLTIGDESAPNVLIMPTSAGQDLRDGFIDTVRTVRSIWQAAGRELKVVAYLGYDPGTPFGQLQPNEAGGLAQEFRWYHIRGKHVTGLGYSYGAQAIAQAVSSHGAVADDVVLLGPWMRGTVSFAGAKRVWLGVNWNDPMTTVGLSSSVASGMRKISTKGSSGHSYLPLRGDMSLDTSTESANNVVKIALGKYKDVVCDVRDSGCADQ